MNFCARYWAVLAFLLCAYVSSGQTNTFKVLVFSKTVGYRHASIPVGIAAIQQLGQAHGFDVDTTENAQLFTDSNLAQYNAVVFLSTTGDVLDQAQQGAFERFIRSGKGYVGVHAASDTEYSWPWYANLVGAYFNGHPHIQFATIEVADRSHPSTSMLPARWNRADEWYDFHRNPRGQVHVLATINEETYDGGSMGFDHPILWCHEYDGGRAWYTAGGHTDESFSEPLFLQHLLGGIRWAAGAAPGDAGATIEKNFQKVALVNTLAQPMALAPAPDGRVFCIEREGRIVVYKPDTGGNVEAARLPVFSALEDGLLGIALDPNFSENGWVYLFYSPAGDTPKQHVSRFTVVGDQIDLRSERILLEIPTQRAVCCHSAGALAFGPDGTLYISTGDNTDPFDTNYSPLDQTPGRSSYDAQRTSGNGNDLRGKILRIRPEADGTYSIPAGNLFPPGTPNTRPEIYVMGARNPFRISVDAKTGWLYWGDVGPDARYYDAFRGPIGHDEWNQTRSAGNYGWPFFIANNQSYVNINAGGGIVHWHPNFPTNSSPNNTGPAVLPPARPAWLYYSYDVFPPMPELPPINARTAFAGPVYHYSTNASPNKLPPYFDKTVFLHDMYRNTIFEVKTDEQGNFLRMNKFLPNGFHPCIDIKVGPDGALYMLEWIASTMVHRLVRVDYVAGAYQPIAVAAATPDNGGLPLTVQFFSEGSQPVGTPGALTYAWNFTGGTETHSTEPNPTFSYTQPGNFNARLKVTDSKGNSAVATVPISAGNSRPSVVIHTPPNGSFYQWGEFISYRLSVMDAEDGTSPGTILCDNVIFETAMGHSEHSHSQGEVAGCEGVFRAPLLDHDDGGNFFLQINAAYADRGALGVAPLTAITTFRLNPKRLEAEHASGRSGVFDQLVGPGKAELSGIDAGDWIRFSPVNLTNISRVTARVRNSAPGARIEVRSGATNGILLGNIPLTGSGTNYVEVGTNVVDPGGTHSLFFLFAGEAQQTNLCAVDSFLFSGSGVGASIVLQSSSTVLGPFIDDPAASINEGQKTILVPIPESARYYRIRSLSSAHRISRIQRIGQSVQLTLE